MATIVPTAVLASGVLSVPADQVGVVRVQEAPDDEIATGTVVTVSPTSGLLRGPVTS